MPTINQMIEILIDAKEKGLGEYHIKIGLPLDKTDLEKIDNDVMPSILNSEIYSVISTDEQKIAYIIGATTDGLLDKYRQSVAN